MNEDRWQVIVEHKGREVGIGDYDSKLDATLSAAVQRDRGVKVLRVALLREGEVRNPKPERCCGCGKLGAPICDGCMRDGEDDAKEPHWRP